MRDDTEHFTGDRIGVAIYKRVSIVYKELKNQLLAPKKVAKLLQGIK
jgi:hypothetical protein